MAIHKSLKTKGKLSRHRNVLSRRERMEILHKEGKWQEGDSVFGLAKVKHMKEKRKVKPQKAPAAAEAAPEVVEQTEDEEKAGQ
jgi:small basic protein (TIGR04137 family)